MACQIIVSASQKTHFRAITDRWLNFDNQINSYCSLYCVFFLFSFVLFRSFVVYIYCRRVKTDHSCFIFSSFGVRPAVQSCLSHINWWHSLLFYWWICQLFRHVWKPALALYQEATFNLCKYPSVKFFQTDFQL